MPPAIHLFLLFSLLLIHVNPGLLVQEIKTSHEIIKKINSAGEMMKCSTALDVLFLLDGSYSVGKGSFERSKHFAIKLCEAFEVQPEKVRVGLIQFGSIPHLEFSLDSHSSNKELRKHMKKVSFRGGSTQTGLAMKYVLRKGFGGGRNATTPRILILLSDGKSQGAVQQAAVQLKDAGVIIFAVGLRYPKWEELHVLASEPVESHVFFAEHFYDAVNGLHTTLNSFSICSATPTGCQLQSYPCERKTLETVKELQGNFMCWKGSKGLSAYTSVCPYYRYNKVYKRHPTVCHRTICPDPCDSQPCLNGGTCEREGAEGFRCVCPPGYGGDPHCAPMLSLDCSVDLLFLIEGSNTMTLEGFLQLKSFLRRFLQAVIGPETPTKVGVAVFGGETHVEAPIGKFKGDVRGLLQAVEGLKPIGGTTQTGQALRLVTRNGFQSAPVFADITDDLPRVVVLLTATPAVDEVVEPAKYARDREIFLIGVGPDSLKGQLNNITGNPQRTLTYMSPDHFNTKIPELKAKICSVDSQGCLGHAVDLVFALDASGGVGRDNFPALRDFVRSVSVQFDVNRDVAQVALVTYGRRPATVFALDAHDSGSAVLTAVAEARFVGGTASTGAALLHVRREVLTVRGGARPGVHKAVVVVTDGSGGEDAVVPAQKLRDDGVPVFVIGVGDVQRERLLMMAGSEDHVIGVPFYEDLKYFEDVLVQMLCSEVKKPVNLCKPNPCMNDGTCVLSGGSFRCQCRGYEGPQCETRSTRSSPRGDLQRPAAPSIGERRPAAPSRGERRPAALSRGERRPAAPSRGDLGAAVQSKEELPRPSGLRRSRQKKSHQELLHHYKLHRRRHINTEQQAT